MINGLNVSCIGRIFPGGEVVTLSLVSSQTILDFDVLIIDLGEFHFQNIVGSPQALIGLDRRRKEILEFLALGRTVVVFLDEFQLEALLPVNGITTVSSSGQRTDFNGPDHLKTFWSTVQKWMTYLVYLEGVAGTPFLYVSQTDKPVATLIKYDKGHILLLPWLAWNRNLYINDKAYNQRSAQFLRALTTLIAKLSPPKTDFSLPSWSSKYGWQRENELRENLASLQQQVAQLESLIETKSQELELEDKLKILFTAKRRYSCRYGYRSVSPIWCKSRTGRTRSR